MADIDAAVAKATELGATTFAGIVDTPAGRIAPLADPTGAMLNLIELGERYA